MSSVKSYWQNHYNDTNPRCTMFNNIKLNHWKSLALKVFTRARWYWQPRTMTMMMIVHKHMYSQRGELQLCILKSISVYDCVNVVVCGEFLPLPLLQRYSKTRGAQGRQRTNRVWGEWARESSVIIEMQTNETTRRLQQGDIFANNRQMEGGRIGIHW